MGVRELPGATEEGLCAVSLSVSIAYGTMTGNG
jgi:hypothetical protein